LSRGRISPKNRDETSMREIQKKMVSCRETARQVVKCVWQGRTTDRMGPKN